MNENRSRIVLAESDVDSMAMGQKILESLYEVHPASSTAKLFETLDNIRPDLILLDVAMTDVNGYSAIRKLKTDARHTDIPIIFLADREDDENEAESFDLGAADYVIRPFSPPRLLKRIANQLLLVNQNKELKGYADNIVKMANEKRMEVFNLQNSVLSTVADLVEFRDKRTGGHVMRTQLYMKVMVEELLRQKIYKETTSTWDVGFLLPSAQLHDVGKIAIPDQILSKSEELTPEEFEIMKTHVIEGIGVIERIFAHTPQHAFLEYTLLMVGTHHEKWDGTGYPVGLKGEDIPLEGRLMAIADVYDALISERSYKTAFPHEKACAIIQSGAGTHFDPALIDIFLGVSDEFSRIARESVVTEESACCATRVLDRAGVRGWAMRR